MKPRSVASSHTGKRGHDVRHASSTSAYGRGLGPIHSRRSRIKVSTVPDGWTGVVSAGGLAIAREACSHVEVDAVTVRRSRSANRDFYVT
jgi:hypothetical protein